MKRTNRISTRVLSGTSILPEWTFAARRRPATAVDYPLNGVTILSDTTVLVAFALLLTRQAGSTCCLSCSFARSANAQQTVLEREAARVETLRRIAPSIVCVMDPKGQGGGSGVLISADGYAISNYHVTSGAGAFMKCGLSDGKLYDAVIVGIDPTGDISLIQLQGRTDFSFAIPGDSDQVQVGQEVMASGKSVSAGQ